jgi:ligand-binding SRPBCC domain-containing protein
MHFCDEQVRGPFRSWQHFHRVKDQMQNGVRGSLLTDQVEYEIPFGFAGKMVHGLTLRHRIEKSFAWRHKRLAEILARTSQVFKSRG